MDRARITESAPAGREEDRGKMKKPLSEEDRKYLLQIWLKHPVPVFARCPGTRQALVGCWCGRVAKALAAAEAEGSVDPYGTPPEPVIDRNSLDCPHE
jgi:hypothetical protein